MAHEGDDLTITLEALRSLQEKLATVDLLTPSASQRHSDIPQLLLLEHQSICIRVDGNRNHGRPHVHVDYGTDHHCASYAIDDGCRLVGNLPRRYDRAISAWILQNQKALTAVWQRIREGGETDHLVLTLKASKFGKV